MICTKAEEEEAAIDAENNSNHDDDSDVGGETETIQRNEWKIARGRRHKVDEEKE